ncbi:flagellar biosynthesis protein FlhF [Hydrogenophaga sp. PAMC20947]|uniref:flagellar biosynthesis protein FlhF n=1 Tax=Hydrogenophaga sp. PAMC20947 TaxID=2565558 RepID=UPI00109D9A45|nr:flagellar biosynthesis protein FlhF [Hydrogenophaga sp. PAMC20947]QCB46808.1 flagellar biosynthesis protein FlhF [Hydrogenophaga sp. PAMC20947]
MNIQRFIAATSREAMSKARNTFGDSAVILSSRATDEGFEVMAAAEESLAPPTPSAARNDRMPSIVTRDGKGLERTTARAPVATDSVESDTEAMSMSTLSFQEYVRERMLRKRKAALSNEIAPDLAPEIRTAPEPRRAAPPVQVPVQRMNEPMAMPEAAPAPIRTRSAAPPAWEDSLPLPPARMTEAASPNMAVELSALKDMIEERFNTLAWLGSSKQNPIQSQLMLKMIRSGYSPSMSRAVLERVPSDASPAEAVRWVQDVLIRNLKVPAAGGSLCDEGGVIALIGATGVGKTTTAAKLAAQCVKTYGEGSVGLITLDTYRVSGYEQLRAYGRMLGVVAHLAHDRAALKDLLNLLSTKRMVIVDTAGLGQRDQRIQDMFDVLDMPKIKKTLVVNAGAHGDTLDDVFNAFKASTLHGVVLSKVDEAVKLGPALDALIRHQAVLRGVANGQRVPEDWQAPDGHALVRLSLGSEGKKAHDPVSTDMGFYYSQATARGINLGGARV